MYTYILMIYMTIHLLNKTQLVTSFSKYPISIRSSTNIFNRLFVTNSSSMASSYTHYCFLVHGWLGNDSEMSSIETSLNKSIEQVRNQHTNTEFVIHKTLCNNHNTSDGIINGGNRLANEIKSIITTSNNSIQTISFVGNSLGGLYARYAIGILHSDSDLICHFNVFCTTGRLISLIVNRKSTFISIFFPILLYFLFYFIVFFNHKATPHLGCSSHTYISIPRYTEKAISHILQQTGRDLFHNDDDTQIVQSLGFQAKYLTPLSKFHKRIAYANAYKTDFQVPTETAAFLHPQSTSQHILQTKTSYPSFIAASLQTSKTNWSDQDWEQIESKSNDKYLDISNILDGLGWKKVFIDVRTMILFPKLSFSKSSKQRLETKKSSDDDNNTEPIYESKDLISLYCPFQNDCIPILPFGHTVMVANAKNGFSQKLNQKGTVIMDHLADEIVQEMLQWEKSF